MGAAIRPRPVGVKMPKAFSRDVEHRFA